MAPPRYLVIVPEADPVATGVSERWGTTTILGKTAEGAGIRQLGESGAFVRVPGVGIEQESIEERLPHELVSSSPTLVFASIHRSEVGPTTFTVHPLGNPGPSAPMGGRPGTLVRTDPALMTSALRVLAERAPAVGLSATYEATHHGPYTALPSFFAELGGSVGYDSPAPDALGVLGTVLESLSAGDGDTVAVGVGGGHYAPHFTELALRRRWAFGHLLSKHTLADLTAEVARQAVDGSPGCSGILAARAVDRASWPTGVEIPWMRDGNAGARAAPT